MQFITVLAGCNFRPAESRDFVKTLEKGFSALRLERDPANPYDSNAVKVIATETISTDGDQGDLVTADTEHFIGFVAKADNFDIALLLQAIDGEADAAIEAELLAPGHTPSVDRVEILDFASGLIKPTIVIEISTGWEVGTLVQGDDIDGDGDDDFLPSEDDED